MAIYNGQEYSFEQPVDPYRNKVFDSTLKNPNPLIQDIGTKGQQQGLTAQSPQQQVQMDPKQLMYAADTTSYALKNVPPPSNGVVDAGCKLAGEGVAAIGSLLGMNKPAEQEVAQPKMQSPVMTMAPQQPTIL